jgi:D-alanine---D-serine ligase
VIESLNSEKYHIIMLGINRQGKWLKYDGNISRIKNDTWEQDTFCVPAVISPDRNNHGILIFNGKNVTTLPVDISFPVLHGKNGEDGTVQGLLELAGIPCVGCGTLSSALCMDKDVAHRLVQMAGIKTPTSIVLYSPLSDGELSKQTAFSKYPLFVKPANAGSSFGITKVSDQSCLSNAVKVAFQHDRKAIVEEAVDGFEVGCAILGNDTLTIGELDEIELSQGFFDYTEKYTLKSSKIHMPARIDESMADRIKQTAAVIYRALGCRGFARVDLFLTSDNEIVFNEVNTIPGLTSHSRYPNMLKGIGMPFQHIVDELIRLAIQP